MDFYLVLLDCCLVLMDFYLVLMDCNLVLMDCNLDLVKCNLVVMECKPVFTNTNFGLHGKDLYLDAIFVVLQIIT